MIDVSKLQYKVVAFPADGRQLDITGAVTNLGFEEGDGEISMRTSFTLANIVHDGAFIGSLVVPGCQVVVYADWGEGAREVARGTVNDWDPSFELATNTVDILLYDELFAFQQSQENYYFPAGTTTKTAICKIFSDWGVPLGEYKGPDLTHEKTAFKSEFISTMVLHYLSEAKKLGSADCLTRAQAGKVYVLPKGSNSDVWHFDEDTNATLTRDRHSIANLVTRVKVVGKEDKEGRRPVEAVLDGHTEFGIRQKIYVRGDDKLDTAKKAAQDLLKESGEPEREILFEGPDVPTLRKGDKVHVRAGTLNGYFYVKSVQHDAAARQMTMGLEPVPEEPVATEDSSSTTFAKGDEVILNGAVYVDSYGNGKGRTFTNYKGKITLLVDTTRACPYHIDHIGWVYPTSIKKGSGGKSE